MNEFFRVRRVGEALAGFRPSRRTPTIRIPLRSAHGRVPVADVVAESSLPGFARSAVDGYAVRAADTHGASESLPAYLQLAGAVTMGTAATEEVGPGQAVAVPTGGALPAGADAMVMVEHTSEATPGSIEVVRPAADGDGVVRADEDVSSGDVVVPRGRPLSAGDLSVLAALGVVEIDVHERPAVTIVSTGDEVLPAETPELRAGQVRDATTVGLAALVEEAGGRPEPAGIVPDDPAVLEEALRSALATSDVVVVSAGSSVGARDATAEVVAGLGEPGVWCHGLAIKPGKPTLLAECGDVPVIGLPGNPLSALLVFRLVGASIVQLVGGIEHPPRPPVVTATLASDVPSSSGRLDVVAARLEGRTAHPLLGRSSQLSLLARADGLLIVPEEAAGLYAGSEVEIELLR